MTKFIQISILLLSAAIGIFAMVVLVNNPKPSIEVGYLLGFGISLALIADFMVLFFAEPSKI